MKPTIPNEVADVIEYLRSDKNWSYEQILECRNMKRYDIEATRILREIPFDTLIIALVNGYERELTEEQRVHATIREEFDVHRRGNGGYEISIEDRAFADGIKFTLNTLNIDIEGVNT